MGHKKLAILLLAVAAIAAIGAAYAYFTDADTADNNIAIGNDKVEVVEDFDPPDVLEPGTSFTKDVTVKNTGSVRDFVRIKAVFTDSDMESYCTVDWNEDSFVYNDEDGYWYYTEALEPGESTASLFTTVTLSDTMSEGEVKEFDILVYAESCQAGDYGTYTEAWESFLSNKPAD